MITEDDAWHVQGHLLLHLLNDNVIPVPRTEIFTQLSRGTTFDWDKTKGKWRIQVLVLIAQLPIAAALNYER